MTNVIDADVLFAPSDMGLRHLPEGPIAYGNGFSWVGIQQGNESMHGFQRLIRIGLSQVLRNMFSCFRFPLADVRLLAMKLIRRLRIR